MINHKNDFNEQIKEKHGRQMNIFQWVSKGTSQFFAFDLFGIIDIEWNLTGTKKN